MAAGDKFWIDRYLYEIPVLTYNEEDLDYAAIMARFHYLLLKKDKETYEEIVKYWALLIITAPDAFDNEKDKHFKTQVFAKVRDSAIKLNRPIEKVEFPPGQPELEQADNFRYENWKPLLDETYERTYIDDLGMFRWYTVPANTMAARSFFGSYCMLMLGAYTRKQSTFIKFFNKILICEGIYQDGCYRDAFVAHAPFQSRISFSPTTATFLRDAFRSQIETYRKVARMILDWNEYHVDRDTSCDSRRRDFFSRYVQPNLIYYGLSIMDFAIEHQVNIEKWLKLKSVIMKKDSKKMILAMSHFETIAAHINGLRRQDGTYLKRKPEYEGENCRFWAYSRLFSPVYFKSLADEDNQELLGFCIGYINLDKKMYDYSNCLENSVHEWNTGEEAKDMIEQKIKEKFEQGWLEGQEIYASQFPPK